MPIMMTEEDQFNWENPDKEEDIVRLIHKYLLTHSQRELLNAWNISIEDMLNGRVAGTARIRIVNEIFNTWNAKLGKEQFSEM